MGTTNLTLSALVHVGFMYLVWRCWWWCGSGGKKVGLDAARAWIVPALQAHARLPGDDGPRPPSDRLPARRRLRLLHRQGRGRGRLTYHGPPGSPWRAAVPEPRCPMFLYASPLCSSRRSPCRSTTRRHWGPERRTGRRLLASGLIFPPDDTFTDQLGGDISIDQRHVWSWWLTAVQEWPHDGLS
jgi:hypothetical protein